MRYTARSIGFMNAGIADPEVRKKKLNAEYLGFPMMMFNNGISLFWPVAL